MATSSTETKKKKNYLNNADLMIQISISKTKNKMTDELCKMLQLLCHRYAKHQWFANYTWVEDMEAYAMYSLCKSWKSFDEQKYKNPFAYYTQSVRNSYFQYLNAEKKHQDLRNSLLIDRGLDPSFNYQNDHDDSHGGYDDYDHTVSSDHRVYRDEVDIFAPDYKPPYENTL